MAVLEFGVELVNPYARRTRLRVVAPDTVLLKEWLYVLLERRIERRWARGCLSQQKTRRNRDSRDGKQTQSQD